MPNLWTDLGIDPPAPGTFDSQMVIRIDDAFDADLNTVANELEKHGYKVSRSEIVRAAARSLIDSILEEFELPKHVTVTQPESAAVSQRMARIGRRSRAHA